MVSRRDKLSGGEIVGWSLAGITAGLLGGVLLAAWLGRGGRSRIRRAIGQWKPAPAPRRNIATPTKTTQAALDASDLRPYRIEVIGVMPGVVELHGWVPSRAIRARAGRLAVAVPGIDRVINCLLVLGEDDKNLKAARALADQPA